MTASTENTDQSTSDQFETTDRMNRAIQDVRDALLEARLEIVRISRADAQRAFRNGKIV